MGNAVVFIIGMFAAAIVGIAASFAMQSVVPEMNGTPEAQPASSDVLTGAIKSEIGSLEHSMQLKINEVADSVDALNSQIQELKKSVQALGAGAALAAAPAGESGQPANPGNLDSVINRVLDDRAKRQEEEREAERAERAAEMQERFKGMVTGRVDSYAQDKGWDGGKTASVKQILTDYAEKMSGMFGGSGMRGMRRGPSDEMRQLMDDTRAKLMELMTEDEANELLRSATGFGGRRGPGGGRDRGPGGGAPGGGR